MTISVNFNRNSPTTTIHVVPCKFSESTQSDVKSNFNILNTPKRTAHLRGRKLFGSQLTLSDGYAAVVASVETVQNNQHYYEDEENEEDDLDEIEAPQELKQLKITNNVEEIHVWAHETTPSQDDPWMAINDMLEMAKAIHTV